jgi:hypothetical protein
MAFVSPAGMEKPVIEALQSVHCSSQGFQEAIYI